MDQALVTYEVGQPYPFPFNENLALCMRDLDGTLVVFLQLALSRPTDVERETLLTGALRLAVVASPPLTWLVLTGTNIGFDAPFDLAKESPENVERLLGHLEKWVLPGHPNRQHVMLHCIDTVSRRIFGIRLMSVSGDWMAAMAKAVIASARFDPRPSFDAALKRDYDRWPNVRAMLRNATAVEVAGRV